MLYHIDVWLLWLCIVYIHVFYLDIYVCAVSYAHNVCQKGYFLAIVSAFVETSNPELEIKPGLDLLGPIEQKWVDYIAGHSPV